MEDNTNQELESEGKYEHTSEYVQAIYNELGMQGALDFMHKDYMPADPVAYGMTPFYAKGRAYFWVYKEILNYALNPRIDKDHDDSKFGINTYEIISHFGSWGELRTTKDDFIVYLIQSIIETMYQRGMGLPEEYAKFTFGFEQVESTKKKDIKGLIFFDFGDAFDLENPITLKRNDEFFRLFFLIRLSLIEPDQIDEFLEYQLQVSFDNDTQAFQRFTSLLLRHQRKWKTPKIEGGFFYKKIVNKRYIKTVEEWFMMNNQAFQLPTEPEEGQDILKSEVNPNIQTLTELEPEKGKEDAEMPKQDEKPKKKYQKQPDSMLPKIEWLGKQKELAELFIELKKKGWIQAIRAKVIQNCFTESNTIDQIIKPAYDKYEPEYEQVYTDRYTKQFENIRPNKKK